MTLRSETVPNSAEGRLEPSSVNVRIMISALWTAMLFVFAYIDIFGLFRPDVRAGIEAGEVGGFSIGQTFLLATTAYVAIPILMIFGSLALRASVSRIANMALSIIYALNDRRHRNRRMELLHPRQRHRSGVVGSNSLLRLDLAEAGSAWSQWSRGGLAFLVAAHRARMTEPAAGGGGPYDRVRV